MRKIIIALAAVLIILTGCSQKTEAQPETETWLCVCGAENTGNFCSSCGKEKNSESESEVSEESTEEPTVSEQTESDFDSQEIIDKIEEYCGPAFSIKDITFKTLDSGYHSYTANVYIDGIAKDLSVCIEKNDPKIWKELGDTIDSFCKTVQNSIVRYDEKAIFNMCLLNDTNLDNVLYGTCAGQTAVDIGAELFGYEIE